MILPAGDRFETTFPGVVSRHCFSTGPFYDPANTSFGPLIGCDEHVVAPGAGFARHAHRGVEIVSVVLSGVLRHEGPGGPAGSATVAPGEILWQAAGAGIEHVEDNGGDEPLRFVQTTFLSDRAEPAWAVRAGPFAIAGGTWSVADAGLHTRGPAHCYIASGAFRLAEQPLAAGDSVRSDDPVTITGSGRLLVWQAD
jgi:hypothetical protein